jgi:ATP-dependent helicase HrpB
VRLDGKLSSATRILYVTEGILLRRLLTSPHLDGVSAILFDEFHERHVYGDITLARARMLQETVRPDLRLVVMSATLETGLVREYLAPCPVLSTAGRLYPVEVEYLSRPIDTRHQPIWDTAASAFDQLVRVGLDGDVLVFMPGAYEIMRTIDAIGDLTCARGWTLLPLYGELPPAEQDRAVRPSAGRKVGLHQRPRPPSRLPACAPDDAGLRRVARFDPHRGRCTLYICRLARPQRPAGRAGRAGGTRRCVRLWTAQEHRGRAPHEVPEIRRIDLAEIFLILKAQGIDEVQRFPWLEAPEAPAIVRAEQLLRDLGAADPATGQITALGQRMVSFPVHPRYARMLMYAHTYGCSTLSALIAALTQTQIY